MLLMCICIKVDTEGEKEFKKIEITLPRFDFTQGHTAEVLSLCFNTVGNQLATGSFDHTVAVWDVASGRSDITSCHITV